MKIYKLIERLNKELPGKDAQIKMAHFFRKKDLEIPNDHKKAAVLILLYKKENKTYFALMKRTSRYGNDKHKGQISFPGGQFEIGDKDFSITAKRETEEELGVPFKEINIIGQLSQLYIPVSNFLVYPYIGTLENTPNFIPDTDEVEEILEVELETIRDIKNKKETELTLPSGIKLQNVPFYNANGNIVWGATAMILSEFFQLLDEIE